MLSGTTVPMARKCTGDLPLHRLARTGVGSCCPAQAEHAAARRRAVPLENQVPDEAGEKERDRAVEQPIAAGGLSE